jgi:pimeloyl-ACP methyl ester carboxylesterase
MMPFDRNHGLPPAVTGERRDLQAGSHRFSYYVGGFGSGAGPGATPLLLIHSINAAGSAYEIKPIYEHFQGNRPVYALELPGFGFSDRRDEDYTPRVMTDAIHAMVAEIGRIHGGASIDVLALSLSSEFLVRAATEAPRAFRSLALISPTGFSRTTPRDGLPGSTRGRSGLLRFLRFPLWSWLIYRLLTTHASIRYFLRRTWGSEHFDRGLAAYDFATARQPGARHAPYLFVSGFLFSGDIVRLYESLTLPVWLVHGIRGDFVDYTNTTLFDGRANWVQQVFPTGAMPHFEMPGAFMAAYESFMAGHPAP